VIIESREDNHRPLGSDSPCHRNTPIFRPQRSKTHERIDIKLDKNDYVGDLTQHANVGIFIVKESGSANA